MKRISQTLKVVLALFVAIFSNGLLPTTAAYAYSNGHGSNDMVFVCKYVGQPGTNESLKPGNNPILVSLNAIPDYHGVGSYFADAQGRSYVLAVDNGQPDPNVGQCPAPDSGPTSITVPGTPSINDPCGPHNASWITPADTAQIDWVLQGNGDLVANTKAGYEFATGNKTSHNYGKAVDSGASCTVSIQVPSTPNVNDPCGSDNAEWIVPADTAQIDWVLQGNGDLVANAKAGYEFATGNKTSHDYGKAVDKNVACPPIVVSVPVTPSVNDPCGLNNATWVLPENTAAVTWTIENGHLIARANQGYIFSNHTFSHDYGCAHDSNFLCVISIPLPNPDAKDPCGLHNAQWIMPHDTFQVDWSMNRNGELVATAKQGYIFDNHEHSHNYGKAIDSGDLCRIVPEQPKFVDYCGDRTDYVYIPDTRGVIYEINGTIAHEGYHKASGTVTVTAEAMHDYVLDDESNGPWTYTYANTECISITKKSLPVTDTNKDGFIGVGDVVTWQITVTNNSNNKLDNFKVQIEDSTATLENDGLIKHLDAGESVTISATSTLTATDMQACKAVNTVKFTAWYTYNHDKDSRHDNFNNEKFSFLSDDSDSYDMTGAATAEATFTCPTPGSGNGGGNILGDGVSTTSTPTTLPSTGPSDTSTFMILFSMAAAYGATYFVQRRRELAAN